MGTEREAELSSLILFSYDNDVVLMFNFVAFNFTCAPPVRPPVLRCVFGG